MSNSIFLHPTDVDSEGIDRVARALAGMGVGEVSLAATYHAGRFLLPHDPARTVRMLEDGVAWYRPDAARFERLRLRPKAAEECAQRDLGRAARDAAVKAGLRVNAWVVALHNSRLGEANPDCTVRNCFDERYPWALCPSQPDVRAYAATLAEDVAVRLEPAALELEAFGFMGYAHQSHHDKAGVKLDGARDFLLSLCFCDACAKRFAARKVDARRFADRARRLVKGFLDRGGVPAGEALDLPEKIGPWLAAEIGAAESAHVMSARREAVVDVIDDVRRRVPRGVKLHLMAHPSPFVTGAAVGGGLLALGERVDAFILNLFHGDAPRMRAELKSARTAATPATRFFANLRAFAPDSNSAESFAQKVAGLRAEGAAGLRIYHYGLMPEASFAWVKAALAEKSGAPGANGR